MGQALTPAEWTAILLSLKVGFVATVVSLPLAFALAYLLARGRFLGRGLLDAAVHLPLVLPPVVTGYLLLLAFGRGGPLSALGGLLLFRWTGVAVAAGIMALPLMVRAMRLSIEAIDRRHEDAARTLGAGRWRTFATVTLPLSLPGVVAGAVLGLAKAMGEFGATITFASNIPGETQTLALAIYSLLQVPGAEGTAFRLSLVAVALSMAALIGSEWVARRLAAHRRDDV